MITGTTFAVLSTEGKRPVMEERLNKSGNFPKISFFLRKYSVRYTIWARSLARVDRGGYDVSYFFFTSMLQKYCTIYHLKVVWKMFMWIFYAFFISFCNRSKVIIKGVGHIIGVGYDNHHYQGKVELVQIPLYVLLILFQFLSKYLSN